jgi:hypothetical protein
MSDPDPTDVLVRRFVDGDLSPDETREALHRIADDAEARELLRFELRMIQDLAASRSPQPPPDFADRTLEALAADDAEAAHLGWAASSPSLRARLAQWWRTLTAPVALEVRPLSAAVVALLLGVGVWLAGPAGLPGPQGPRPTASGTPSAVQRTAASPRGETVWIRFRYTNNEADSVAVAGDFSQWDPIPLSPRTVNGQTVWTGLVPVSRGEHEYQFVINGERWVTDPLAPTKRSDGFGAQNAVLKL